METVAQLGGLAVATLISLGAALALGWLLLRGMFHVMRPAAQAKSAALRTNSTTPKRELAHGLALQSNR